MFSDEYNTYGGIPCAMVAALVNREQDIANYVNVVGGSLMVLTQGN